jgi:hypothetical protein
VFLGPRRTRPTPPAPSRRAMNRGTFRYVSVDNVPCGTESTAAADTQKPAPSRTSNCAGPGLFSWRRILGTVESWRAIVTDRLQRHYISRRQPRPQLGSGSLASVRASEPLEVRAAHIS